MSPARSKRQPLAHRRSRSDLLKAVAAAAVIIGGTSLLIWLVRPGPAGIPGTGGLMNRQPRVSWLVGGALGAGSFATWWILRRSRRARSSIKIFLPAALVLVLAATVGAGVAWPGGLLRHAVAPAPEPTTTPTTTTTTRARPSSTTTARSSTSAGPSTSTTRSTGATGTGATGQSGVAPSTPSR